MVRPWTPQVPPDFWGGGVIGVCAKVVIVIFLRFWVVKNEEIRLASFSSDVVEASQQKSRSMQLNPYVLGTLLALPGMQAVESDAVCSNLVKRNRPAR